MKWTLNCDAPGAPRVERGRRLSCLPLRIGCVVLLGAFLMAAEQGRQQQDTGGQQLAPGRAAAAAAPDGAPAAPNRDTANAQKKKQIADDSARLLQLATDLKTEVDKTDKDTLSLNVIRKADELEKLAHSVKEKMKLAAN